MKLGSALIGLLLGLSGALGGCVSGSRAIDTETWSAVTGSDWQVVRIDGAPLLGGTRITVLIDPEFRFYGQAQNRFHGRWIRRGVSGLRFDPIVTTRMHLDEPPGAMDQETRFLQRLEAVDSFEVDGDRLVLRVADAAAITLSRSEAGPPP